MKIVTPVLASKISRTFIQITAGKQATSPLDLYSITAGDVVIGSTSSTDFVVLYTSQQTIDVNGKIVPFDINLIMITDNDANGECKIQISGNGGTTYVDMTDEIPEISFVQGSGAWITSIDTGENKLRMRVLGRSTDGNPATIRIWGDSFIDISVIKS